MPAQAAVAAALHASTNRLVQHMLHQAMWLTATNPPRAIAEVTSRQLLGQHWALLGAAVPPRQLSRRSLHCFASA